LVNINIRLEEPKDYRAVEEITRAAFITYVSPVDDLDKGALAPKNRTFHHISKNFTFPLALPKIV